MKHYIIKNNVTSFFMVFQMEFCLKELIQLFFKLFFSLNHKKIIKKSQIYVKNLQAYKLSNTFAPKLIKKIHAARTN